MKYLKGKNVLAAILCATMMLGIVPFTVFAANTDGNLYTKKQISASVQYLNQERTQAEITYSVPIGPQEPVNVIFLVDASKTGENSKNEVVELIMGHGDGVDLMYKYGTKNNVNIISYASDVQETGFINSKEELQKYSSIETMSGEADEAVALEKAASAVQQAHEMNGNPTVVVWALGSSFNKEAEVDEQLKALDQVLSENDAFITYQMTDAPSTTLQNYATKFIPAGGTDEISADAENLNLIWNIGTKSFSANHWNLNDTRQDLSAASDWLISNITELKGWRGVSGVTSMEGMLAGQSRLESVSITEANMPNLTSTANMFSGCTKLTEVDLSGWTGMESTAITGMFSNAPANIDLIADSDAIGTAIKEEYEKNTSTVRKTMENAGVKSIKKNNVQRNTKPAEPKHTAEEDTSMYGTIEQPLVKEVNKENNEIRWHEVETPAGTELYLKTTIQYVGDIGAKSEDINLEVVLPQGMVPAQKSELVIGGFQYTGEETGYRSGSVEAEPTISANEAGKTVMTAKVGSMYTGTEIEMSFKVKLEDIAATGQYKLWDVTATTKDKNSTAKDALRFWEAVTTEGTEYPITIESTGTGQAWTEVIRAAPGMPITVYTQGGTVESITATDSNGNKIDISEAEKVHIAAAMQETNQYTFQMPSAAVTVKVVFAQSQQPQTPGETPQTGDMEGTGGMDSPRTGDTNSMVAIIAAVSMAFFDR